MKNRLFLHFGFWAAYLILEGYTGAELANPTYADRPFFFRFGKILAGELLVLPWKMGAVYFVLYHFLPRFQNRKNWLKLLIISFLILLVIMLGYRFSIGYLVRPWVYDAPISEDTFAIPRILWGILDVFFVVGIATAIKLVRLRLESQQREQQLLQEKLTSELQFLRAQTNPHFLFNTLNNIYALARKQSPNTAPVVMKLSKLLRFMLYECTSSRIPIADEVKVIQDYIELEKLRYNDRLKVNFEIKITDWQQAVAPLLLLPLVENAFKHGASETRFETIIDLFLRLEKGNLIFKIKNTKDLNTEETIEGIGLKNVKRQLELIYPSAHELLIANRKEIFEVYLKISMSVRV